MSGGIGNAIGEAKLNRAKTKLWHYAAISADSVLTTLR